MINTLYNDLHSELNLLGNCHRMFLGVEPENSIELSYPLDYFNQRFEINDVLRKRLYRLTRRIKNLTKKIKTVDLLKNRKKWSEIITELHSYKLNPLEIQHLEGLFQERVERVRFEQIQHYLDGSNYEMIDNIVLKDHLSKISSFNNQIDEAIKAVYKADKVKLLEIIE